MKTRGDGVRWAVVKRMVMTVMVMVMVVMVVVVVVVIYFDERVMR